MKAACTVWSGEKPEMVSEAYLSLYKSETALLQAIILMLLQEAPEYEQDFTMVMRVLEYAQVKEKDEEYVSPLDMLFGAMEEENPASVAVRQYKVFKQAAGEDKTQMFLGYSELLSALDTGATTKLTIHNRRINRQNFAGSILRPMQGDPLDGFRQEYNEMLLSKITGSAGSIQ